MSKFILCHDKETNEIIVDFSKVNFIEPLDDENSILHFNDKCCFVKLSISEIADILNSTEYLELETIADVID